MTREEELLGLVREMIAIFETVEETDEGREFMPTKINSCRTQHVISLGEIFTRFKELTKDNP
jgi:hypothetical protein